MTSTNLAIGTFFRELRSFASSCEANSRELRASIDHPPLSRHEGGYSTYSIVEDINSQVTELEARIDDLKALPGSNPDLSLRSILECIGNVYRRNELAREELEARLIQYGYKKKPVTTIPIQPIIPPPVSIGDSTPTQIPSTPPSSSSTSTYSNPRTPDLDDIGISASSMELFALEVKRNSSGVDTTIKEEKGTKRQTISPVSGQPESSTISPPPVHPDSTTASILPLNFDDQASTDDNAGFIDVNPRRGKKKKPRSSGESSSLFPLISEVTEDETSKIPDYLKSQVSLDLLNKCIGMINERVTDMRFGTVEEEDDVKQDGKVGPNQMTEPDLRDYLKLGLKTKALILILVQLKRIASERRGGDTIFTILDTTSQV